MYRMFVSWGVTLSAYLRTRKGIAADSKCSLPEDYVASLVSLPCLDKGKVTSDGLLHNVVPPIELTVFPWGALKLNNTL